MKTKILTIFLIFFTSKSFAWDGTVTGKIKQLDVEVVTGNNAGFRITLENNPALCGNQHTWAYINKSAGNYEAAVSVLLSAKLANASVTLYANSNTDWNGYCNVGYIVLR